VEGQFEWAKVLTVVGSLFDPSIAGNPIPNSRLVVIALVGIISLAVCVVASLGSLIVRARRANAEERHQLRWIAAGGVIFVGVWLLGFVASAIAPAASPPGFGGNGLSAAPGSLDYTSSSFGKINSTREGQNDQREIQFALKFYW